MSGGNSDDVVVSLSAGDVVVGDEKGMLEDMYVAVQELVNVSFKVVSWVIGREIGLCDCLVWVLCLACCEYAR